MKTLSVVVLVLFVSACGGGGGDSPRVPDPPTIQSITVFPSSASRQVGQTQQFTAVVKDTNGNIVKHVKLDWSTGDAAIATIDTTGLVTALADGTTTVRATRGSVKSQLVTLTVTATPLSPAIGTSPTSLSFTAQAGTNPATQTLTISNTGGGTLSWSASESAAWLSLSPASGTDTGAVTASVATGSLTAGSYSGAITLSAPGTASITIPVALTVTAAPVPPALGVSPTSLSFTAQQGGSNPVTQTLTISNTGGGTLTWSVSHDATWLGHAPNTGGGTGTVTISVTTGTLTAGTYRGVVGLHSPGLPSVTVPVLFSVTPIPVGQLAPLPPWLTYCQGTACAGIPPVVVAVCPNDAPCAPSRSTSVIPQVNGVPISGVFLIVQDAPSLQWRSGDGDVISHIVLAYTASSVQVRSDLDVTLSSYLVPPVWGGVTPLNFIGTTLTSPLLETVFYRHPSYPTGSAASDLHATAQTIITKEREMTGITSSERVTAYFLPTEFVAVRYGEGNFSYGNGTITVNYGNPGWIAYKGGIQGHSLARFAHEYAHELFDEIDAAFLDNPICLNEGIADAVGFTSGFLPVEDFGPVGVRGLNFEDDGCPPMSGNHDIGNCYFWHVKKAGLLTPAFVYGLFHPQHQFSFDSCVMNAKTGNSLLVYFTEAAGGANLVPALDAMKIPHAGSYDSAKGALGL